MNLGKAIYFFLVVFILMNPEVKSQNYEIYNPYITHYSKSKYGGGIENWDVLASKEGYIYFANNEGLLEYDGHKWKLYNLPNKTIVRSISEDQIAKRIYAGGQDEVGYFYPDNRGSLIFQSLKHLLPEENKLLEDVWEIQIAGVNVIFRSVSTIFIYDQQKISVLAKEAQNINFVKYLDGIIYYADPNKGVYAHHDSTSTFIDGSEIFKGQRITEIIRLNNNKILFITERKGIYEYNRLTFRPFLYSENIHQKLLSCAEVIDKNLIAVGSVLQGVFFLDTLGRQIYNLTKQQGLQTNSIISLVKDINGNLWAGTTNGIEHLLINSPFSILYPDGEMQGGAYAIKIFRNKLYIGTNNGLFYSEWSSDLSVNKPVNFKKVNNSEGQVWSLDVIGDNLFMGHNEGAFQILDDNAVRLSVDFTGTWRFIELADKNFMLTGTYTGFQLFKKSNDAWQFVSNVAGFKESARIVAKDKNDQIWVSHPYRGVYKLTFNHDFTEISKVDKYGKENGLPDYLANYIVKLKDDVYVSGENGIFKYIQNNDLFSEETEFVKIIGKDKGVRRLFQDNPAAIWYVKDDDSGVLLFNDSNFDKTVIKKSVPFLNGKLIGGFENIYAPDKEAVFVCTDKGVILIDFDKLEQIRELSLRFTEILFGHKEKHLLYGGHIDLIEKDIKIDYNKNNIFFSFSTNQLDVVSSQIKYRFILEGFDKEWSEWTDANYCDFKNLKPGKYTLKVQATSTYGVESNELNFRFRVKSPWYKSSWAYFAYFLVFGLCFILLIKYLNKKHEVEKVKLKNEKELSEAKLESLQNEKLQSEIEFKNRELALSTMLILQKNETLAKLKEELQSTVNQSREPETRSNLKKVINILSDDQKLEDDWDSFAIHFDQVHTDFLRRLKIEFSQLSPKDLKLCAYLKMNMSSKDIAPLLNISVRGVEISRYRLRKKINLDSSINLNDFMMSF